MSASDPSPNIDDRIDSALIVEDDAILAMSIEQTLADAGITSIHISSTIADAVKFLRNSRPDAIILDVHLPDRQDGYAIAEIVSALKTHIPRIVFSTGAPKEIPPSVAKLGTILEKPYRPEQLIAALKPKPKPKSFLTWLSSRAKRSD